MTRFINTELKSDSDSSHLEVESKSDNKLMAKLKPDSDSEEDIFTVNNFYSHIFVDFEHVI